MADSSLIRQVLATTSMLVCLGLAGAGRAQTAAEIDWVPATQLSASQVEALPWYCHGLYLQPPAFAGPAIDNESQPIHASADSATHGRDRQTELIGNVELHQGQRLITSPHLTLDDKAENAHAEGPMTLREPGLLITGSDADVNLATGTGTVSDATFLLHEASMRGKANTIRRDERTDLIITQGKFTRCEPDSNIWSFKGRYIRLEPRTGFGTARNVTVRVKDVPVAWLPYMRFPIDDQRHSGFLVPGLSHDSDGGTDITIPYYFNLAPQYDATYTIRSMWKRGLIHDGQFRFMTRQTDNEVNAAFLRKDDIYDDREIIDQTTAGTATAAEFEKHDRWLLYLRHDGGRTRRWQTSVSYSAVSDTDYLHDIGGNVGSSAVQKYYSPIDRNLSDRRSAALDRQGEFQYRGDSWTYKLLLHGFQNLDPDAQAQYEILPRLSATYADSVSLLDVDLDLQYTYFDKDNEGLSGTRAITGQRGVIDASVSAPLRNGWGFLTPTLGVVQRNYDLLDVPTGARTNPDVTTPEFSLDTGLFFDRFFDVGDTGLQQTLEPRIYYLYVAGKTQDDLPTFEANPLTPGFAQLFRDNRFSGYDRIGDANQLSVGLTTRFMHRDTGVEFLSASIGQIYYFRDRTVLFSAPPGIDSTANSSALFTETRVNLANGLRFNGSYEWDPHINRSNRGKVSLKYNPDARHIFNVSYINTNSQVENLGKFRNEEESDISFIWPAAGQWSVIGRWNFGWDENQTIESLLGFEYNDCCWKTRLVFRRFIKEPGDITLLVDDPNAPGGVRSITTMEEPADFGIFFEFQMKGLATLGRQLDSLLEAAIPGYRQREEQIGFQR